LSHPEDCHICRPRRQAEHCNWQSSRKYRCNESTAGRRYVIPSVRMTNAYHTTELMSLRVRSKVLGKLRCYFNLCRGLDLGNSIRLFRLSDS
jgi:hypothetical protein